MCWSSSLRFEDILKVKRYARHVLPGYSTRFFNTVLCHGFVYSTVLYVYIFFNFAFDYFLALPRPLLERARSSSSNSLTHCPALAFSADVRLESKLSERSFNVVKTFAPRPLSPEFSPDGPSSAEPSTRRNICPSCSIAISTTDSSTLAASFRRSGSVLSTQHRTILSSNQGLLPVRSDWFPSNTI